MKIRVYLRWLLFFHLFDGDRSQETFRDLWWIVRGWCCLLYITRNGAVAPLSRRARTRMRPGFLRKLCCYCSAPVRPLGRTLLTALPRSTHCAGLCPNVWVRSTRGAAETGEALLPVMRSVPCAIASANLVAKPPPRSNGAAIAAWRNSACSPLCGDTKPNGFMSFELGRNSVRASRWKFTLVLLMMPKLRFLVVEDDTEREAALRASLIGDDQEAELPLYAPVVTSQQSGALPRARTPQRFAQSVLRTKGLCFAPVRVSAKHSLRECPASLS